MREFPISGPFVEQATTALASVPLFKALTPDALQAVVASATMNQFDADEAIVTAVEANGVAFNLGTNWTFANLGFR